MAGPLEGIRVLEFTQIIAGPFGCQHLADMGAEVIKVEPPEGEPWRLFSQFMPGESKTYQSLNRGKKSLVLKLQDPRAREVVHRLVPQMDVVVINYRPDVPAKLGIDYETLSALKSDLIYVDNTAWGRKGPWANRPGYDIIAQAVSGLMAAEGKLEPSGAPGVITSTAIADYTTGVAIAWGVSAALFHRERTGQGQLIETNLLRTAIAVQGTQAMELPAADGMKQMKVARIQQLREQGASYPELLDGSQLGNIARVANIAYRTYRTSDGAIAIGALSPSLWAKVRAAIPTDFMGMEDPEFDLMNPAFVEKAKAAVARVEQQFTEKTTQEWVEIMERHGVPAGPVNFVEDAVADPQAVENEIMVELDHPLSGPQRQVGPLISMSNSPLAAQGPSPVLGADTEAIVASAGYSAEEIASMREAGVIA
ncbi:MAG: CoA transferase [Dehalococcoidia bacterium]|nr:CoA transferase [Dehalococcoidia bacterium]